MSVCFLLVGEKHTEVVNQQLKNDYEKITKQSVLGVAIYPS